MEIDKHIKHDNKDNQRDINPIYKSAHITPLLIPPPSVMAVRRGDYRSENAGTRTDCRKIVESVVNPQNKYKT